VELSLPDRATVERATVSIWDAPVRARRAPGSLNHRIGETPYDDPAVEAGRIVAVPQVLSRGDSAVVVLTRLTAIGDALSLEILSVATGEPADAVAATAFPPPPESLVPDDPEQARTRGPGASIAVLHDHDAVWVGPHEGWSGGGGQAFRSTAEFSVARPRGGVLDLLVAWPAAGLPDVRVTIPLSSQ
jgi:hypothetical protein